MNLPKTRDLPDVPRVWDSDSTYQTTLKNKYEMWYKFRQFNPLSSTHILYRQVGFGIPISNDFCNWIDCEILLHSSIYYQFLCSLFDAQIISYSSGLCQCKAVLITSLCCFPTWFWVKVLSCKYVSLTYLINLLNIAAQAHYMFVWCDLTFIWSEFIAKERLYDAEGTQGTA